VRLTGAARRTPGQPLRLRPDTAPGFWEIEATPLHDPQGAIWGVLAQLRDVTAQQAALRRAETAQATLDALFDHIPEGLLLAEAPEARLIRVSAHGLHLAGLEAAAVLGQEAGLHPATWQVFHQDGTTPAAPEELPLTRAVRRGETVRQETWLLRRRDGTVLPILCSAGPIHDAAGRISGGILVCRDVTDLTRAEAALAASEARYRALVEAGALAVWTTAPDGRLLRVGDWADLTGQTPGEAADWGWLDAVHPEDRERVRDAWAAALALGRTYEAEYRLRRPDADASARWRWTAARAVPLRDAAGRITEWVGATTDIDLRKRAEQALLASEDRFRTLAEAMPHLVWQTDARGEPEYMNQRLRRQAGLDLAATRHGGWLAMLHPEDAPALSLAWEAALEGGGDYEADTRLRGADGGYRWFQVRGAPVRDAAGRIRHWVGTCTDMEDRHRAEDALREALAAQQALAREAEHRIKNSLQLVAALLRLQAGRMEEPAARIALEAATARVQAEAEAHRALQNSPDLKHVRLADMLHELAVGAAVQHPGADLRTEAPEGLTLDAERAIPLALILSELVAKALRHAKPGPGAGPVRLSARLAEGALLAMVEGQGRFLPDEDSPEGRAASLGATVIRALSQQIGATLATEPAGEGGTRVLLRLAPEAG
jgi:PAS domain S-box-containing protein